MSYQKKNDGSKQDIAYQIIKNAIINHEFEPDSMLVEGMLCEKIGFSKTPIREALRRLASEKYVEFIPEKGTFVSRTSVEELIEIFDVREALEGMAARMCATRKDKLLIAKLQESYNKIFKDLIEENSILNIEDDLDFHCLLVNGSMNNNLITFSMEIMGQIKRYAAETVDDIDRLRLSYHEHNEILNAVIAGDADHAERSIREHIRSVKEYQIQKLYR